MELLRLSLLFAVTAVAEIVGCYLPWLVIKQGKTALLLLPAALSLALTTARGLLAGRNNTARRSNRSMLMPIFLHHIPAGGHHAAIERGNS